MLTCRCDTAVTTMKQALSHLHEGMIRYDTVNTITTTFYNYVASRGEKKFQDCVPPYNHSYSEDLYNIIVMSARSQNNIGWKLFIEG